MTFQEDAYIILTLCFVYRLLSMGLQLLQGSYLPNATCKTVLRERLYAAALDYFA